MIKSPFDRSIRLGFEENGETADASRCRVGGYRDPVGQLGSEKVDIAAEIGTGNIRNDSETIATRNLDHLVLLSVDSVCLGKGDRESGSPLLHLDSVGEVRPASFQLVTNIDDIFSVSWNLKLIPAVGDATGAVVISADVFVVGSLADRDHAIEG